MGWLDYRRGNAREALPLLERAFRLASGRRHRCALGRGALVGRREGQGARGLEPCADRRPRQCAGAARHSSASAYRSCRPAAPVLRSSQAKMLQADYGAGACRVPLGWLLVLLALLCAGCVTTRPPPLPAAQPWEQRLAALQAISDFAAQRPGRGQQRQAGLQRGAALAAAGRRRHDRSDVRRWDSAPRISSRRPDGLRVTTAQGTTLTDAAASQQLAATLGFEPPLGSLRFWVLGASDPALSSAGIARRAAASGASRAGGLEGRLRGLCAGRPAVAAAAA